MSVVRGTQLLDEEERRHYRYQRNVDEGACLSEDSDENADRVQDTVDFP